MRDPVFRVEFSRAKAGFIKKSLAGAIHKARLSRGMTRVTLAKRARTTQTVISRIENPRIPYLPSVEVLSRLASAVGATLSISTVVRRVEERQKRHSTLIRA
ncbi:MAG: helix-turn-helix transcriptional regulator [bacterium]